MWAENESMLELGIHIFNENYPIRKPISRSTALTTLHGFTETKEASKMRSKRYIRCNQIQVKIQRLGAAVGFVTNQTSVQISDKFKTY